jgi:hypothetical protein
MDPATRQRMAVDEAQQQRHRYPYRKPKKKENVQIIKYQRSDGRTPGVNGKCGDLTGHTGWGTDGKQKTKKMS